MIGGATPLYLSERQSVRAAFERPARPDDAVADAADYFRSTPTQCSA
jgi:hypothetical protein